MPTRRWKSSRVLNAAGAAGVLLLLLAAGTLAVLGYEWFSRGRLSPSGGWYFAREKIIPVPLFRQSDDRWRHDLLGDTPGTLGAEGCAISSIAMVFGYYGIDTDPQRLNGFLTKHGGYTPEGWVYWEKAALLAPDRVRHVYENLPSHYLIDSNLWRNNPVIIRLRLPGGITHFVVIAGKRGFDYLIRDPGAGAGKGVYPLKEIGSKIEALRFYQKL